MSPESTASPQEVTCCATDGGTFKDVTEEVASGLGQVGMVTDALWTDVDDNGKKDLVIVGEWMPLAIFTNDGERLERLLLDTRVGPTHGWWNSIRATDMDGDGDTDLIAGNLGLNSKFKADGLRLVELYVNDFDDNGTGECIIARYGKDGKSYPFSLRNDMVAQMPILKKKFLKHGDYAGKTIREVFGEEQLAASVAKKADELRTCLFVNEEKGGALKRYRSRPWHKSPLSTASEPAISIRMGPKTFFWPGTSTGPSLKWEGTMQVKVFSLKDGAIIRSSTSLQEERGYTVPGKYAMSNGSPRPKGTACCWWPGTTQHCRFLEGTNMGDRDKKKTIE